MEDAVEADEELSGEFLTDSQIQALDILEKNLTLRETVLKFCGKRKRGCSSNNDESPPSKKKPQCGGGEHVRSVPRQKGEPEKHPQQQRGEPEKYPQPSTNHSQSAAY